MSKYKTITNKAANERTERNRARRDENRANPKSVFEIRTMRLNNRQDFRNFVSGVR